MSVQQSGVCCCDCCNGKRAVIIYTSIFLGLCVLGFYHFSPLPNAIFGLTFITDKVVDDANAYCIQNICKELCDCNGTPCDMHEDISVFRGCGFYYFAVCLFGVPLLLIGLFGAAMEKPTLLWYFMFAVLIHQLMTVIAGIVFSGASDKAIRAWYLYNAKEHFDDHKAECYDWWFDTFQSRRTESTIVLWLMFLIGAGLWAHVIYSAKRARDDFKNAKSSTGGAAVDKPVILGGACELCK